MFNDYVENTTQMYDYLNNYFGDSEKTSLSFDYDRLGKIVPQDSTDPQERFFAHIYNYFDDEFIDDLADVATITYVPSARSEVEIPENSMVYSLELNALWSDAEIDIVEFAATDNLFIITKSSL